MDFKAILTAILAKLSFLSNDETVSITNLTVIVFVTITAFRAAFGGSTLILHGFTWNIQPVDYASALTVLFSLWNYDRKRQQINQTTSTDGKENNQ